LLVESGFDGFVMTSITAIVAPPGTPIEIRRRLNQAVAGALTSEEVERSLSRMGGEGRPASPEELASYLATEQQRWARIIETTRISIERAEALPAALPRSRAPRRPPGSLPSRWRGRSIPACRARCGAGGWSLRATRGRKCYLYAA